MQPAIVANCQVIALELNMILCGWIYAFIDYTQMGRNVYEKTESRTLQWIAMDGIAMLLRLATGWLLFDA